MMKKIKEFIKGFVKWVKAKWHALNDKHFAVIKDKVRLSTYALVGAMCNGLEDIIELTAAQEDEIIKTIYEEYPELMRIGALDEVDKFIDGAIADALDEIKLLKEKHGEVK